MSYEEATSGNVRSFFWESLVGCSLNFMVKKKKSIITTFEKCCCVFVEFKYDNSTKSEIQEGRLLLLTSCFRRCTGTSRTAEGAAATSSSTGAATSFCASSSSVVSFSAVVPSELTDEDLQQESAFELENMVWSHSVFKGGRECGAIYFFKLSRFFAGTETELVFFACFFTSFFLPGMLI